MDLKFEHNRFMREISLSFQAGGSERTRREAPLRSRVSIFIWRSLYLSLARMGGGSIFWKAKDPRRVGVLIR